MPSQQADIAETIAALKRALNREKEAPSAKPILAASNRGNKLKQGAKYVHEGTLAFMRGPDVYKHKIEHAGYARYILERNPRRYNEYGDELDDSESDPEADEDAADENAYAAIRLEELLCPLKHPSELPVHPTLSHPYLSAALPDMVKSTQDKLRQEKANLWRAKHLNRQLIGDESWMPCGSVESPSDWDLFEPRKRALEESSRTRKRKREGTFSEGPESGGTVATSHTIGPGEVSETMTAKDSHEPSSDLLTGRPSAEPSRDVAMPDVEQRKDWNTENTSNDKQRCGEAQANQGQGEPEDAQTDSAVGGAFALKVYGPQASTTATPADPKSLGDGGEGIMLTEKNADDGTADEKATEQSPRPISEPDEATPPAPTRRITRALAASNTSNPHSTNPTPPLSPTPTLASSSTSSLLQIDPLFVLPPSIHSSNAGTSLYGLPGEKAAETRRLLTTYIQKQEESVRGFEGVLAKLLKAQRLRDEVFEMCKAEGHVGEMSDGEDWIDHERWGLQPGELRKGRDDDEDAVEENTIGGRKGKRRARN